MGGRGGGREGEGGQESRFVGVGVRVVKQVRRLVGVRVWLLALSPAGLCRMLITEEEEEEEEEERGGRVWYLVLRVEVGREVDEEKERERVRKRGWETRRGCEWLPFLAHIY